MTRTKIGFFLIVLTGKAACSSVNVETEYSDNSDFSSLKSFAWFQFGDMRNAGNAINPTMDTRIRKTIENNLGINGFLQNSSNPDFVINYIVTPEDKIDINTYNVYNGYVPNWSWKVGYGSRLRPPGMGGGIQTTTRQYIKGTLIIDVIDPTSDKIIWRGMGSRQIPPRLNFESADKLVEQVVSGILKNFPS